MMKYIMDVRTHFSKYFPDFSPGNIYHGYMDMTYFPIATIDWFHHIRNSMPNLRNEILSGRSYTSPFS
ncbi:DUF7000 family protein [Chloroflexota bacterium]